MKSLLRMNEASLNTNQRRDANAVVETYFGNALRTTRSTFCSLGGSASPEEDGEGTAEGAGPEF
jgi:hypothetical protein